jgi:hypothetical protein
MRFVRQGPQRWDTYTWVGFIAIRGELWLQKSRILHLLVSEDEIQGRLLSFIFGGPGNGIRLNGRSGSSPNGFFTPP